ncbi:DUF1559 domain-containing protein, partial [Mariniblastus sp.]|nr:DUF1559 domain-containing protein [Mariniblastus sp.]
PPNIMQRIFIMIALVLFIAVGMMMPTLSTPKEHTDKNIRLDRLRDLTRAIHKFEENHERLPSATFNRERLLSWRVQLLPYLGEQELFDKIDKTVSWDHSNNKPFHDQMPLVYSDPAKLHPSLTSCRIISGAGTPWADGDSPVSFESVIDGSSNTIAIISLPNMQTNWLAPMTLSIENSKELIAIQNEQRNCHSYLDGHVSDGPFETYLNGSPFLIADAE